MIFQAYKIGQNTIHIDLPKWDIVDLNGKEPFIYHDILQGGYTDITSIKNIYEQGVNADVDFKRNRDILKDLVINKGQDDIIGQHGDPSTLTPYLGDAWEIAGGIGVWSGKDGQVAVWNGSAWDYRQGDGSAGSIEEHGFSLIEDSEDKKRCASWIIGTISQQIAAYSVNKEEKAAAQLLYKKQVQDCRFIRYKYAENDFLQEIPQYAAIALSEIEVNNMGHHYFEQGIDGEIYGDVGIPGLADWVNGYGAFSGAGLVNKPWTSLYGKNMTTYAAEIDNVLFGTGLTKAQQALVQ